jgi:hypothetical protein
MKQHLPTNADKRKAVPLTTGVLDYFPDALVEVANLSRVGNEQHNPGQPLHWSKDKSTDHADCIVRHLLDRGTYDTDGVRHSTKVAWRALAMLQIEIEEERSREENPKKEPSKEKDRATKWVMRGIDGSRWTTDGKYTAGEIEKQFTSTPVQRVELDDYPGQS